MRTFDPSENAMSADGAPAGESILYRHAGSTTLRDDDVSRHSMRRSGGFTLIEVMVVVAIISILATISIGVGGQWLRRDQAAREAREVYQGLNRGRSEAVKRGSPVKVEITSQRMTVFRDANDDDAFSLGDTMLYQYPAAPGQWLNGVSVDTTALAAVNGKPVAIFDNNGFSVDTNARPFGGNVIVTDTTTGGSFTIELSIAGALRIQ